MISDLPGFWRGFRIGAACGVIVGGIAFCTPARAAPFAAVTGSDGSTVTLRSDKGPCVGDAMLALWQSADATRSVPGCWVMGQHEGQPVVLVSYLDGDRGLIPAARLVKVRAS